MVHGEGEIVRIGCGAGFADDRSDAAVPIVEELARHSGPRFLMFETLAERTLALTQIEKRQDPSLGASPSLERFLRPILGPCLKAGIRIVGNFGAANPRAAAATIARLAAEIGHPGIKIAVVEGDDVTDRFSTEELALREGPEALLAGRPDIISANAYLGAFEIAAGFDKGADVVVTGRVADPSLALGPLLHVFKWGREDWDLLAAGTLAGHLLECGSQVTGGYFADPGVKDVDDGAEVGYPIALIDRSGAITITKAPGTGGRIDRATVTEQILYEIHDPARYLTPDVVLDVTEVEIEEAGSDVVHVEGAKGHPLPDTLKATVCIDGGFLAEAEISYAGPHAAERSKLAIDIVRSRLAKRHPGLRFRADAIGIASLFNDTAGAKLDEAWASASSEDVRVRFAASAMEEKALIPLIDEVKALYCAGPAAGGGIRARITPRFASASCYLERDRVSPSVSIWKENGDA